VLATIKVRPGSAECVSGPARRPTLTASVRAGKRAAKSWDDTLAAGSPRDALCIGAGLCPRQAQPAAPSQDIITQLRRSPKTSGNTGNFTSPSHARVGARLHADEGAMLSAV